MLQVSTLREKAKKRFLRSSSSCAWMPRLLGPSRLNPDGVLLPPARLSLFISTQPANPHRLQRCILICYTVSHSFHLAAKLDGATWKRTQAHLNKPPVWSTGLDRQKKNNLLLHSYKLCRLRLWSCKLEHCGVQWYCVTEKGLSLFVSKPQSYVLCGWAWLSAFYCGLSSRSLPILACLPCVISLCVPVCERVGKTRCLLPSSGRMLHIFQWGQWDYLWEQAGKI